MTDTLAYLQKKGFSYRVNGSEAVMNCPICHSPEEKFSINLQTGLWQCFRKNTCGKAGNLFYLKRLLGDSFDYEKQRKNYERPREAGVDPGETVFSWFQKRGITQETVCRFGVRQKGNAIVFPFYRNGELINQKYRTRDKQFHQEKNAEPVLFGMDLVPAESQELIITEGEIDCMSLAQLEIEQTVSVPSGASNLDWIENCWPWLEGFETIYLAFDMDAAGEEAVEKIVKRLGYRCKRVQMPHKDANEWLQHGMTFDDFAAAMEKAEPLTPAKIRQAEDYFEQLLEPDPEGLKTGFRLFDKILGGFRPGELTLITGRDHSGKTTWLNQLTLELLVRYSDTKVCLASFEAKPKKLLRKLATQAGIFLRTDGIEPFRTITDYRLYFIDVQEIQTDALLESMEYLHRRDNVSFFIVDSLLKIDLGDGDYYENQRAFMRKIVAFAVENDVHVILCGHPRKGQSDGQRVQRCDIAGTADLSNLAFNVVSMTRRDNVSEGEPSGVLEVLKNREKGRIGVVKLFFDKNTERFTEVSS